MGENALDLQVQECLREIQKIEKELTSQLQILSETIDKNFGTISTNIRELTNLATESTIGLVTDKRRAQLAMAGAAASVVVDVAGQTYAAYKHNQKLDKIMEQKRKIAEAKKDSIVRIIPIATKVNERLEKLLINEAGKRYVSKELKTSLTLSMLVDNMDKFLDMYRTSEYFVRIANYLKDEYEAWNKGKQTSTTKRPDSLDVNKKIISLFQETTGENPESTLLSLCEQTTPTVSGSTIYYLMDPQLSSTILLEQDDWHQLPDLKKKRGIRGLLYSNVGIKQYQEKCNELYEIYNADPISIFFKQDFILLVFGFIIMMCTFAFGENKSPIVALSLLIIMGYFCYARYKKLNHIYKELLTEKQNELYDICCKNAGFMPDNKEEFEYKSVVGTAVGTTISSINSLFGNN